MQLFLDTADMKQIKILSESGLIDGITTKFQQPKQSNR